MILRLMAKEFSLSVVAPDRTVFEDSVESTVLPGVEGYLGVFADHEPMIVALRPGVLEYKDKGNQRHHVSIDGGFAEVGKGRVIVLADNARRAAEIDVADTERRLEEARRTLRGEASGMSTEDAQNEMELALARLRAARTQ
jgi:F-type H+-transporting ATPase subunit epsilon